MSVALAMMGISAGLGLIQGIQKDQQIRNQRELQKYNEKAMETNLKMESASIMTKQYKSFSAFMEGHESVVASQENYLNATSYDPRGTVRQGVYQQQKEDFYSSQQTTESNIKDIESKTNLALLGQQAQNEINKYGYKQAIANNKMETLTNFFGSATQIGMATGMFSGGATSGLAGSIPTQTQASPRTGVPLLGGTNNRNLV